MRSHPFPLAWIVLLLAMGCDSGEDDTTPEGYSDTAVDADADTDTGDRGGCPCLGTT